MLLLFSHGLLIGWCVVGEYAIRLITHVFSCAIDLDLIRNVLQSTCTVFGDLFVRCVLLYARFVKCLVLILFEAMFGIRHKSI